MADPTYQMLWRCTQCQTADLLALTQRFCPNCGTAQDPTQRYFPPEGQETAVENHLYVGVDWRCLYCETPNSAKASHCTHCGGPKERAKPVDLVVDGGAPPPGSAVPQKTSPSPTPTPAASQPLAHALNPPQPAPIPVPASTDKRGGSGWLAGLLMSLVVVVMGWLVWQGATWVVRYFSVHTETVTVTQQTWQRTIDLEQFVTQSDQDWCDNMPNGAYNVLRFKEQRSTREVADGETCHNVRSDHGDGTFTSRRECETRWRSEPVYDDRCRYNLNRWAVVHTERLTGNNLQPPSWPALRLANQWVGGSSPPLGVQREGRRTETYQVTLKGSAPNPWTCTLQHQDRWQSLPPNSQITLKVRGTGAAVCSSLEDGYAR